MSRRTRILRWLVLPLLLGAATTIAVAWGLAAWLPQQNWDQTLVGSPRDFDPAVKYMLDLTEYRATGATLVESRLRWRRPLHHTVRISD